MSRNGPGPTTDPLMRSFRIPEHVVFRSFVNETVVLNLKTQRFHGLNPTAGRMAEVLDREKTARSALAVIAADFGKAETEVEPHLSHFIGDMLERGLLEQADG